MTFVSFLLIFPFLSFDILYHFTFCVIWHFVSSDISCDLSDFSHHSHYSDQSQHGINAEVVIEDWCVLKKWSLLLYSPRANNTLLSRSLVSLSGVTLWCHSIVSLSCVNMWAMFGFIQAHHDYSTRKGWTKKAQSMVFSIRTLLWYATMIQAYLIIWHFESGDI